MSAKCAPVHLLLLSSPYMCCVNDVLVSNCFVLQLEGHFSFSFLLSYFTHLGTLGTEQHVNAVIRLLI